MLHIISFASVPHSTTKAEKVCCMPYQTHHVHRVCGGAHRGQWARGHASGSGTKVWAHGLRHLVVKGARRASKCVRVDKERAEKQHAKRRRRTCNCCDGNKTRKYQRLTSAYKGSAHPTTVPDRCYSKGIKSNAAEMGTPLVKHSLNKALNSFICLSWLKIVSCLFHSFAHIQCHVKAVEQGISFRSDVIIGRRCLSRCDVLFVITQPSTIEWFQLCETKESCAPPGCLNMQFQTSLRCTNCSVVGENNTSDRCLLRSSSFHR